MIYVDELIAYPHTATWRYNQSCHMYADTLDELHAMASKIGLKRSWFQNKPELPHYDLTASKRQLALRSGAKEHTLTEMVAFMKARRVAEK